jgi:hypothetical protein
VKSERLYQWEAYPEYVALQQYARCLGAVLSSARPAVRRRATRPLVRGATLISQAIAGAHAEDVPELERSDRLEFREAGLECIALCREGLRALKREKVSTSHLTAALELLERVEHGLLNRPLPGPDASV